jgi:hypothetical protein
MVPSLQSNTGILLSGISQTDLMSKPYACIRFFPFALQTKRGIITQITGRRQQAMGDNGKDIPIEGLEEMPEEEEVTYTALDDERREELDAMIDLKVVGIELEVWDEDEEGSGEEPSLFDCDLYLDEGQALELYAAVAYPDPEGEPIRGADPIFDLVGKLVDDELALLDYQEADEEGGLLLAFGKDEEVSLVVLANEWMVSEWEADDEEEGDEDDEDDGA